jgi:hypothetical protein
MRIRRVTLAKLAQRQKELGSPSLNDALETVLFRQRAYEAIARLRSSPEQLEGYQREAHEWAEVDTEVHDE